MNNPTDIYDTKMTSVNSVGISIIHVACNNSLREEMAALIMSIEKFDGDDKRGKIELANLLISGVTDDVYKLAEGECK